MRIDLKTALNDLEFLHNKSIVEIPNLVYVKLIGSLKLGIKIIKDKYILLFGECFDDCFSFDLFDVSSTSILLGIKALRKTDVYKLSIMRQRFI